VGCTTVGNYLRRLALAEIGWPIPDDLDEAALGTRLFGKSVAKRDCREADWSVIHRELKRPGVTQLLL
jgi:transposase